MCLDLSLCVHRYGVRIHKEYSLPAVSAPSPHVTVVERTDSSSVLVYAVVIPGFMQIFFFLSRTGYNDGGARWL